MPVIFLPLSLKSSIDFACRSKACAPPPIGTGGSNGSGSPSAPAAKKPKAVKTGKVAASEPKHNETEFTKRLRAAIDAEPALSGSTKSAHAARVAEEEAYHQERVQGRIVQSIKSMSSGYESSKYILGEPELKARAKLLFHDKNDKLMDPNAKFDDPFERDVHAIVQRRLTGDPHSTVYGEVRVEGYRMGVSISIPGVPKPKIRGLEDPAITKEFEEASTRVGKLVDAEIEARFATKFDGEKIRRDVQEVRDFVESVGGNPGNVWFTSQGDVAGFPEGTAEQKAALVNTMRQKGIKDLNPGVELTNQERAANREAFQEVMSEVRSMGGQLSGIPAHRAPRMGLSSNEQVNSAAKYLPSDWIEASNRVGAVNFKQTKGRAHYSDTNAEVTLDGSVGTAVHELNHRMEYTVPGLRQLEATFFARRTDGQKFEKLQKLRPGHRYGSNEEAIPDGFFDPYVGKEYSGRAYEIMSMGVEAFATGKRNAVDPDYRAFILGAMTTLYREG